MSYDLFFCKQKGSEILSDEISNYLSANLAPAKEGNTQWFYLNKDTEVYFSFEYNKSEEELEHDEDIGPLSNFVDTNFTFNINFMRPSFFGHEAFKFVEQFCFDLNLYVFNPQSDSDQPYKPSQIEQFQNWNKTNLWASRNHFDESQDCYLSEEECFKIWEYNSIRNTLQKRLGDGYFVPKIFFFKTIKENKPITLTIWTEHIPIVLPTTDYILLTKKYKKLFRTVQDAVLISRTTLLNVFGNYFENFDFPNCKIIHPNNSNQVKDKFNSLKTEFEIAKFAERLAMENLYNAKPI
jgi:hypothetical protein